MTIFLYTLRVFSPTPAGRVPVSSHPSGAQSHRFAAGRCLTNINESKHLSGRDLVVAAQATVQIDAEIGQKDPFRIGNHFGVNPHLCVGGLESPSAS
ncbi:hypothetical protein TRIP_B250110 [uncultured Desulfatiglans sp.]|nr:hypothetical protein TRIP_B250110 [uncultured Desulfatiglans sp.]